MPAIRGVYYAHPQTGERGLWAVLLNGNVIGGSDAQLNAMVPTTGDVKTRVERARAIVESWLQAYFTSTRPSSDWTAEDWEAMVANPEPFCVIDGNDYVCQESVVSIEVFSINPLRYQITISEGASRAEWRYE